MVSSIFSVCPEKFPSDHRSQVYLARDGAPVAKFESSSPARYLGLTC